MLTVVSAIAPSDTPVGSVPKASSTLSSSSSMESSAAVKVIVFDISSASKVTLVGTV